MSLYDEIDAGLYPRSRLERLGFRAWDEPANGVVLMLIPEEFSPVFHADVRDVYVTTIFGHMEAFKTAFDRDTRFGMLSVGFVVSDDLGSPLGRGRVLSDVRRSLEQTHPDTADAMMLEIERGWIVSIEAKEAR